MVVDVTEPLPPPFFSQTSLLVLFNIRSTIFLEFYDSAVVVELPPRCFFFGSEYSLGRFLQYHVSSPPNMDVVEPVLAGCGPEQFRRMVQKLGIPGKSQVLTYGL